MYMQVPSGDGAGKEDEVGKMTDVCYIVPLLQAIFAILLDRGKTLQTVAVNCETVSTKSARLSPVGGFAVPQLVVLLPDQAQSVLRGDVLLHSQGVWHGGQGQYRQLFGAHYRVREGGVRAVNLIGCVRIHPP